VLRLLSQPTVSGNELATVVVVVVVVVVVFIFRVRAQ
jgi:hypothetical protein